MLKKRDDRRLRIYYVDQDDVANLLFYRVIDIEFLVVHSFEGVPSDAELLTVFYDQRRQGFAFVLAHPTFEDIAPGCELPAANSPGLHEHMLKLDKGDKA